MCRTRVGRSGFHRVEAGGGFLQRIAHELDHDHLVDLVPQSDLRVADLGTE